MQSHLLNAATNSRCTVHVVINYLIVIIIIIVIITSIVIITVAEVLIK